MRIGWYESGTGIFTERWRARTTGGTDLVVPIHHRNNAGSDRAIFGNRSKFLGNVPRFLGLPLGPSVANLVGPLQTQRPEVEVRTAKAFLTPENLWSFAHAQQHTQFFT